MDRKLLDFGAWAKLTNHRDFIVKQHLRELFAADTERGARLTLEACGIYFDYSKQRVTDETLALGVD